MRKGFADLFIAQFNSLFYGVAFALIGWTIAFFYGASYGLTLTASSAAPVSEWSSSSPRPKRLPWRQLNQKPRLLSLR
jgi:hypothetical protein